MKRRGFLRLLGIAPAVVIAEKVVANLPEQNKITIGNSTSVVTNDFGGASVRHRERMVTAEDLGIPLGFTKDEIYIIEAMDMKKDNGKWLISRKLRGKLAKHFDKVSNHRLRMHYQLGALDPETSFGKIDPVRDFTL